MGLPLRGVRRLVAAGLGAQVVRAVARNLSALRPVAPDLRSPALFLPLAPSGPRQLRAMRWAASRGISIRVADGICTADRIVEVTGREPTRVVTYERPDRTRPSPVLLWFHGGGTVMGRAEQANCVGSAWADQLDVLVVSVDYRLAPEHPFPAGLEDCYTALLWLHGVAGELGIDPARVAVGGESAGGLLAASVCQLARERAGPAICFQLLEYPMLDDRTASKPDPGRSRSFIWSPAANRFAWTSYLGGPPGLVDHPGAAPARALDLAGLPPAWIGVGDADLLHDEAVAYAAALRDAGVPCELHVEPGMYHGAPTIGASAVTSQRFSSRMTDALAAGLAVARVR